MNKPFISVCTPTYNRRPFIPYLIKCFLSQDYPQNRMEWIILDDGTDKIHDLVKDISNVKYYSYDKKIALGEKRNLMHSKCRGSIIVYMDDDDYYPPDRVSHAVEMLTANPQALCAGSSIMHVYFKHLNKIYQLGPYGPNHATAGTFAFRKQLLNYTSYDEKAVCSEEKHFLKNYTIPFIQLDPTKTILVITHPYNTFDKKKLLINPHPQYVRETILKVDDFIKTPDMRDFYMNRIHGLIKKYKPNINEAIKEADHVESVSPRSVPL
jgi:glycosyltransferase involved in cell wall biosynthesis